MNALIIPDMLLVEKWLNKLSIDTYDCKRCEGVHFSHLQSRDGIADARLEILEGQLLFFVAVEIRTSSILALATDLLGFNKTYIGVKTFLDLAQETSPQFLITHTISIKSGLNFDQFRVFVSDTKKAIEEILYEIHFQGYASRFSLSEESVERMAFEKEDTNFIH